jgi:hypothetical protein
MLSVNVGRAKRVKQARFALVEALRVQRVAEVEQGVVQVMAELVQQRPEEGAVGHHLAALGGQHPDSDDVTAVTVRGCVETLQLAAAERGAAGRHTHAHGGHAERRADAVGDPLREGLHLTLATSSEHVGEGGDRSAERRPGAQRHARDTIARRRDPPESRREPAVPCGPWSGRRRRAGGERHGARTA